MPPIIVIRLLNSILRGCEFELPTGKTLFIVGNEDELLPQHHSLPENTIFVPMKDGGINFEIQAEDAQPGTITLYELAADTPAKEIHQPFNTVSHIGKLTIAIRRIEESWSEEIINYQQEIPAPASHSIKQRGFRPLLIAVTTALLIGTALFFYNQNIARQHITHLSDVLGDQTGKYQIHAGQDNRLYIIANNERDASWARQALIHSDFSQPTRVISLQDEARRIRHWLAENEPGLSYHRLQIDNPLLPRLLISLERSNSDPKNHQQLSKKLKAELPYAGDIEIVPTSDHYIAQQAQAGLERLAAPFTRINNPDSVTFVIQGALADSELQNIRTFVDDYYRQWDGRYVQFAIELKDDWLKGKSFTFGNQGYVKMAPQHWYFPPPTTRK
ncbi:PrgH/EprH family type III secretion apparatus protein [Iodobacter ciconiae]|nr:PrgH/EprH family type III secretion apparatus protein [Iodobacter ciconiae]